MRPRSDASIDIRLFVASARLNPKEQSIDLRWFALDGDGPFTDLGNRYLGHFIAPRVLAGHRARPCVDLPDFGR